MAMSKEELEECVQLYFGCSLEMFTKILGSCLTDNLVVEGDQTVGPFTVTHTEVDGDVIDFVVDRALLVAGDGVATITINGVECVVPKGPITYAPFDPAVHVDGGNVTTVPIPPTAEVVDNEDGTGTVTINGVACVFIKGPLTYAAYDADVHVPGDPVTTIPVSPSSGTWKRSDDGCWLVECDADGAPTGERFRATEPMCAASGLSESAIPWTQIADPSMLTDGSLDYLGPIVDLVVVNPDPCFPATLSYHQDLWAIAIANNDGPGRNMVTSAVGYVDYGDGTLLYAGQNITQADVAEDAGGGFHDQSSSDSRFYAGVACRQEVIAPGGTATIRHQVQVGTGSNLDADNYTVNGNIRARNTLCVKLDTSCGEATPTI